MGVPQPPLTHRVIYDMDDFIHCNVLRTLAVPAPIKY